MILNQSLHKFKYAAKEQGYNRSLYVKSEITLLATTKTADESK